MRHSKVCPPQRTGQHPYLITKQSNPDYWGLHYMLRYTFNMLTNSTKCLTYDLSYETCQHDLPHLWRFHTDFYVETSEFNANQLCTRYKCLCYGLDELGFGCRQGQTYLIFSETSRPAVGAARSPIQWADHLSPSTSEVTNEWSYNYTPPYAFMAYTGTTLALPLTFIIQNSRLIYICYS
jgi:hypothetical protein